jgi:DamX protein
MRDPFPEGRPDDYFFTTPALRLRLDLIREHIGQGDSPVLLVGEHGAGKTTLLHRLVLESGCTWRIVRLPPVSSFSAEELITCLANELDIAPHSSDLELFKGLDRWLERLATRGELALVVVDDAHRLGDECLSVLAELPGRTRASNLRVLLCGEPAICSRLRQASRGTSFGAPMPVVRIPSMDEREVARYIDMRLYHAGMDDARPFSRAIIGDIARDSRGRPGHINAIAGRMLRGGPGAGDWQHRAAAVVRRVLRSWKILGK